MSKQSETTAEALGHYGVSYDLVILAGKLINDRATHVPHELHAAASAAWEKHAREFGSFVGRFTPRGNALYSLVQLPIEADSERRSVKPISAPQASAPKTRPTLTLPKRRSTPQGPTSNPKPESE